MESRRFGDRAEAEEVLRAFEPFADASDEALALLARISVRRKFAADVTVVRQGDGDNTFYGVVDGLLQATVQGGDGREIVLGMIRQGHMFGDVALFDPAPRSATVSTLRRSELISFPADALLKALRKHPDICLKMMGALARRVRRLTEHVEELSVLPIQERLARKLLELCDVCGVAIGPHQIALPPGLSQQDLANHVQATRESVNKSLSGWIREGIVRRSSTQLIICKRSELEALAKGTEKATAL
jgi:CRP/FNR family transcriptional regulator, cyclic AMP receptor protein